MRLQKPWNSATNSSKSVEASSVAPTCCRSNFLKGCRTTALKEVRNQQSAAAVKLLCHNLLQKLLCQSLLQKFKLKHHMLSLTNFAPQHTYQMNCHPKKRSPCFLWSCFFSSVCELITNVGQLPMHKVCLQIKCECGGVVVESELLFIVVQSSSSHTRTLAGISHYEISLMSSKFPCCTWRRRARTHAGVYLYVTSLRGTWF